MNENRTKRILEIIPGFLSWSIIIFLILLFIIKPLAAIIVIIIYLIYWICRLLYSSLLLLMTNQRILSKKNYDWLVLCKRLNSDLKFENIIHVVLYTTYKETKELLAGSLNFLKETNYPKDKIIVVLAGEERAADSYARLEALKKEYKDYFLDVIITIHPKNIEGEIPTKGANATFSAKQVKVHLEEKGYDLKNIIISCFDADTCPDKSYFSCLTYNFLNNKKRYQMSFQPLPVYSNNIYSAPAFARVIEVGSTFWQLIEGMRFEKFITFSSHSMSFDTLVKVDYWPVDLISDDSLIFWKCFLKYNGDYKTFPLDIPVYMDIAVGRNFLDTIAVQYRQKRRWAWGVENFTFVAQHFLKNKDIPLFLKIRKLYQILDGHISWATWAIIISFITPLVLFLGKIILKNSLALFNLTYINGVVFHSLTFILMLCVIISWEFTPPRPKNVSRFIYLSFLFQWLLTPLISAALGSTPSLDAQTRLMFGKYLSFNTTPKQRKKDEG